ncbi:hypothetical protein [Butyrivibrio fibrisolvens]|uniref:hypothetical protein n=1 Tax=Butyrivibrio fibrisolvens TaxID=831 RepID=UPI00041639B7|nr:hypothetical protein [Butyrivibrio fibrisolvens]
MFENMETENKKKDYLYTQDAYAKLEHLCITRFYDRYRDNSMPDTYQRMEKELLAIKKQGTAPLFLVAYEALSGVEANPMKFCLRGDMGSSIVAYLMGFSEIDPANASPKLYSEFCFGLDGEDRVSIEMIVTKKLYKNLVRYFEHYTGNARIRHKHCSGGKERGVGISDPQIALHDYYDDNELYFGFLESSGQKKIARRILAGRVFDTVHPSSYEDQVKCRGLSVDAVNGVWEENAEELFKSGTAELKDLIAHREDVYEYLIGHGIDRRQAYKISDDVTWGRIKRNGWNSEILAILYESGIPEWYIKSCEKIVHLFPRAHSMMELQHYGYILKDKDS